MPSPSNSADRAPKIRSGVAGVEWPPLPSFAASALLILLDQFENSEQWPPDLLRQVQFRQVTELVAHARNTAPFWRKRLDDAGYRPGAPVDGAVWDRLSILTRAELRGAGAAVLSTAPPAAHGRIRESAPLDGRAKLRMTMVADRMRDAFAIRHRLWHGYDFSAKRAVILGPPRAAAQFPDGAHHDRWDRETDTVFETGPSAELNADTPIADQLTWLVREDPEYLLTSPANLARLVRHAPGRDEMPAKLRAIETVAGLPDPRLREQARKVWNLPVHGSFGIVEIGPIALQCPAADHFHVAAESALIEIVNGDGGACVEGETGRIVATPLHNFATPLLRFDTGFLGEVGASACPCGRTLPVLNRILAPSAG